MKTFQLNYLALITKYYEKHQPELQNILNHLNVISQSASDSLSKTYFFEI